MGTTVARHLAARGAPRIAIVNRTLAKARAVASQIGARAHPFADLAGLLAGADLAISAVGSGDHLVTSSDLEAVMARRPARPLLVIDIGAPRDIEPAAGAIANVTIHELADLRHVVDESIGGRRTAMPAAESIVDELAHEYVRWYQSRAAVPLIASLRTSAERIRAAELEKLFARRPELDAGQRAAIAQSSIAIINKLLHEPLTRLRETAARTPHDDAEALDRLVDLASMEKQIERQFTTTFTPPTR